MSSASKKPDLTNLIAIKGSAAPALAAASSAPAAVADKPAPPRAAVAQEPAGEELAPLNFKVPLSFKREFKTYAASKDIFLHELLKRGFEAYRKQQGD